MKKQTWLWSSIMLPAFLIGNATAPAFGTYGINSGDFEAQKAERLAARMLSITANQNLSRKQLKRKALKQEKGDNIAGRYSRKIERDQRKQDRRLAAKDLW